MSATNTAVGFLPVSATRWTRYYVPASDTTSISVGDPVKSSGVAPNASGLVALTLATPGAAVRGVVVAVGNASPANGLDANLTKLSVPANKGGVEWIIWVNDDPNVNFILVDDGVSAANLALAAGKQADFTSAGTAGLNLPSSCALSSSSIGTGTSLLIIGPMDGTIGAFSRWQVKFQSHELASDRAASSVSGAVNLVLPTNTGAAAANTAAIQAALDAADHVVVRAAGGKGGIVWFNLMLLLNDFQHLEVAAGTVLKGSDGVNTSLIRPRNHNAAARAATGAATWAASATPLVGAATADTAYGYLVTVPLAAHGLTAGDAIEIQGATDFGWNGARLVYSTPDVDTITYVTERPPVNTNPTGTLTVKRGNKYITLSGDGEINVNGAGQTVSGSPDTFGITLNGVHRPTVKGLKLSRGKKYVLNFPNCSAVTVRDIRLDTDSDGVHFQGSIWGAVIDNISGRSGDDFVAFTGGDYNYYTQSIGDFDGIEISNIYPATCIYAVKFTGNDNHRYGSISVRNVRGVVRHGAVYAQNDTWQDKVRMDHLTIDTVDVQMLFGASYWACIKLEAIEIKKLTLKNLYQRRGDIIMVGIESPTAVDVLDVEGVYSAVSGGITWPCIYTAPGSSVNELRLSRSDITISSNTNGPVVRQSGYIKSATLENNNFTGTGTGSWGFFQTDTATGLEYFGDINNRAKDMLAMFSQNGSAANGATKLRIQQSGGRRNLSSGQSFFHIRGTHDTDIAFAYPEIDGFATGFLATINATATGVHNVVGNVNGQQGVKMLSKLGGTMYVNSQTIGADITQVARRDGSMVYNTNASANNGTDGAVGAGLFACVGAASGSWKRLGTAGGAANQY